MKQPPLTIAERVAAGFALLWPLLFALAFGTLVGCQSPRASYANGLILWCSTSAVGIGYGQYIEVPSGGKLTFVSTNSAPCIVADGRAEMISGIVIDNTKMDTYRSNSNATATTSTARDGAEIP